MDELTDTSLPLGSAILAWVAPDFIENVRHLESRCTRHNLDTMWPWPRLLSDNALRLPTRTEWMGGDAFTRELQNAWLRLVSEVKKKVRAGDWHLTGVMIKPDLTTEPQPIPGAWASELKLDLVNDVVIFGPRRFAAVRISKRAPSVEPRTPALPIGSPPKVTPENLPDLSDDMVLLLLEEHARRVIANGTNLISPGKVSLLPIVRGKMRHRAEHAELLPSLKAETVWLADWISSKVQLHQSPSAATIEKVLSSEYWRLNPRSKPAI